MPKDHYITGVQYSSWPRLAVGEQQKNKYIILTSLQDITQRYVYKEFQKETSKLIAELRAST